MLLGIYLSERSGNGTFFFLVNVVGFQPSLSFCRGRFSKKAGSLFLSDISKSGRSFPVSLEQYRMAVCKALFTVCR